MMNKRLRRLLFIAIYIAFALCMMILLLEALLWHLDPLGAKTMGYNLIALSQIATPHPTGYQIAPGTHALDGYTVTIDDEGSRILPDSGNGDCVIIFVGDSMTYGQGVNDNETFANLVASQLPDVVVRNTARAGYSVENVAELIDYYPADGYIWFVFYNDNAPAYEMPHYTNYPPALELYASVLRFEQRKRETAGSQTWGEYESLARDLIERNDVFSFGYDDDALAIESSIWGTFLIPDAKTRISFADGHPTVVGHEQIARAILPDVQVFVDRICYAD